MKQERKSISDLLKQRLDSYCPEVDENVRKEWAQRWSRCYEGFLGAKYTVSKAKVSQKEKALRLVAKAEVIRQKWLRFFSERFTPLCSECEGRCCTRQEPLVAASMIRVVLLEPQFQLPVPDFDFLKDNPYHCLMLSKNGCLLGPRKPSSCLFMICCEMGDILEQEMGKDEFFRFCLSGDSKKEREKCQTQQLLLQAADIINGVKLSNYYIESIPLI